MQKEQIAYVNGNILPESQASISINDRGFIFGDAVFDTARTFNGKLLFLEDHVDRLFDSCKYLDIDPVLSKTQIIAITKRMTASVNKTIISKITNSVMVPKIPALMISTRYVNGFR